MKHRNTILPLAVVASFAASPALAQEDGHLSREQRAEQAAYETPRFVKAASGPQAIVSNEAGELMGFVRDHVIDQSSGKVQSVALASEGTDGVDRSFLVPFDRFSWESEPEALVLSMSRAELEALPEYDPSHFQKTPGAQPPVPPDEAFQSQARGQVAGSQVLGSRLLVGEQQPFGSIADLILAPQSGTIALVLAQGASGAATADPYAIPWEAMTWEVSEDQAGHFVLPQSADELADAPTLERGDVSALEDKATVEEIFGFYDLSPPLPPLDEMDS